MLIGIDTGGTFTDLVLYDGRTARTVKVPSTPDDFARGVLDAIDQALGNASHSFTLVHASTVATNALLEGKVARAALLTTRGCRDVLAIGRQQRPALYDLHAAQQVPLIPRSLRREVKERISAEGEVLQTFTESVVDEQLTRWQTQGIDTLAVCLLFSFLRPEHEKAIARLARKRGFSVSLSSEILPEFREYERTSTTVINACVSPIMRRYIQRIAQQVKRRGAERLRIVQSNGGSLSARAAGDTAVHTLLSGPAAGVAGAFACAQQALSTEHPNCITFDMGGTSTDVALLNGEIATTTEMDIAGYPARVPMIDIHTVGAGGGSIARIDAGGALLVGPESVGADPGPACYGKALHASVTDANVVLGRIVPAHFLGGKKALHMDRSQAALSSVAKSMGTDIPSAASAIVRIVNANMERAIRVISVERGYDPRHFTLLSFGGAGGLHAFEVAEALHIPRVLIPRHPGVLSAWGTLSMDVMKDYSRTVMCRDPRRAKKTIHRALGAMTKEATRAMRAEGFTETACHWEHRVDLRYAGQSFELSIPLAQHDDWEQVVATTETAFHARHRERYGHAAEGTPIEWVTVRTRVRGKVTKPKAQPIASGRSSSNTAKLGAYQGHPIYDREELLAGHKVRGPALLVESFATTWLPKDWHVTVDTFGHMHGKQR